MSVEQEISIKGYEPQISTIIPNDSPTIKTFCVTNGLENNTADADYYIDIEIYCAPNDQLGTIAFDDPINKRRQGYRLSGESRVKLGIKLDGLGDGTVTWRHIPEKGIIYPRKY